MDLKLIDEDALWLMILKSGGADQGSVLYAERGSTV